MIVNPGIPGPPMPAEPQRPLYLDEVCLFYPELKIVMAHGADPGGVRRSGCFSSTPTST